MSEALQWPMDVVMATSRGIGLCNPLWRNLPHATDQGSVDLETAGVVGMPAAQLVYCLLFHHLLFLLNSCSEAFDRYTTVILNTLFDYLLYVLNHIQIR